MQIPRFSSEVARKSFCVSMCKNIEILCNFYSKRKQNILEFLDIFVQKILTGDPILHIYFFDLN